MPSARQGHEAECVAWGRTRSAEQLCAQARSRLRDSPGIDLGPASVEPIDAPQRRHVLTTQKVFFMPDREVLSLLEENQVELVRELRAQGLDVTSHLESDPTESGADSRLREPISVIILAAGISLAAVSAGVARIISALKPNHVTVDREELRETTGEDGSKRLQWVTSSDVVVLPGGSTTIDTKTFGLRARVIEQRG